MPGAEPEIAELQTLLERITEQRIAVDTILENYARGEG